GALHSDRCIEERVSGDYLSILPDTALNLRLAPDTLADVRTVARLMPRDVLLVLPPRELERPEIAATFRAAAVLRHRGMTVTLADRDVLEGADGAAWSNGIVMIGQRQDFPRVRGKTIAPDALSAVLTAAGPALLVGNGESAAAALPLLNSRWLPL